MIADRLVNLRQSTGLSEEGLAHYLGCPLSTVKKWLRGERVPSSSAVRLIEVLEVLTALAPDVAKHLMPQGVDK